MVFESIRILGRDHVGDKGSTAPWKDTLTLSSHEAPPLGPQDGPHGHGEGREGIRGTLVIGECRGRADASR